MRRIPKIDVYQAKRLGLYLVDTGKPSEDLMLKTDSKGYI